MRSTPPASDLAHATALQEQVGGSGQPVDFLLAPTLDGLYTPYALCTPPGPGPFPVVLLGYGNGGGGMPWLRDRVRSYGEIMERLLRAGYASAWMRYRSEVELGYHHGGPLVVDRRQGMDLLNRAPLEFEDEVAIIDHVRTRPRIDPDRVAHVGVSHAGEMLFKLASRFPGLLCAGVASEPANHEFLNLRTDESVHVNPATQLRDIESMQMRSATEVRSRVDEELARERISTIETPILVMGRDHDHLQGIFEVSYQLLTECGKETEWVSWDHPVHGYLFPERVGEAGVSPDAVQDAAVSGVIGFLDRYLAPRAPT